MNESSASFFSTSLSAFAFVSVTDFGHSYRFGVVSRCFDLHFPDDMHLLLCLFATCMSFLVKYLLKSLVHFLVALSVFLLLSFESPLYISVNSPLSHMSLQIISRNLWLVFLFS